VQYSFWYFFTDKRISNKNKINAYPFSSAYVRGQLWSRHIIILHSFYSTSNRGVYVIFVITKCIIICDTCVRVRRYIKCNTNYSSVRFYKPYPPKKLFYSLLIIYARNILFRPERFRLVYILLLLLLCPERFYIPSRSRPRSYNIFPSRTLM